MNRLRRHRQLALFPAVVWLLVQFVMTGIFTGSPEAAVSAGDHAGKDHAAISLAAIPGLSKVVICTPSGFEVVTLENEDHRPAGESGHPGCDWCQSFGSAPELAAPADGSTFRRDPKTIKFRILAAATLARHGVLTGFDSRAPPL